ncbi:hypothetical protein D3C87_819050 [compost metagenome]|uniref:Uncharacterized protein n=1 Tax=Variovorax boronicumulans TaxID=436515 RepID=A0AAW8DZ75_9BURK|nr:hypothetical protein [Variovorax boronicumulans]MDP9879453.1 hypothetical protein [Variovorax boronicumulans]MDP9918450.1 hypothetical protein [Variovorax boronicumulans]MDP9924870.1 hypothetical protein [Variovorax boronicumulans]
MPARHLPSDTAHAPRVKRAQTSVSARSATPEPPRRRIHDGGASRSLAGFTAMESSAPARAPSAARPRNWRTTLLGVALGLVIAMLLLMKWLLDYQVGAAEARHAQEAQARTQAARCFGRDAGPSCPPAGRTVVETVESAATR